MQSTLSRAQIKRLQRDNGKRLSSRQLLDNIALLQLWVQQEPGNPTALRAYSQHLVQAGKRSQAIDVLLELLTQDPDDLSARATLIDCLSKCGRHGEALQEIDNLDFNSLTDIKALEMIAVACGFADAYDGARAIFARLTELEPAAARHWANLGTMQHYCHKTDAARETLRKAVKMDSRLQQNYWILSQTTRATGEDNDIAAIRKALSRKKVSPEDTIALQFALARQLEDIGEYDEAFKNYTAANTLKYQQYSHDPKQDTELFKLIKEQYKPGQDTGYSFGSKPIFICGLPRSGTSLVEQILSVHSDVTAGGEMHEFYRAMCLQAGSDGRPQPQLQVMQREPGFRYTQLGKRYISSVAHKRGRSTFFTDKMPANSLYLGTIAKALPNAKLIVVQRQALDSIVGNYKMLYAGMMYPQSYNLDAMANYYEQHLELQAFWREELGDRLYTLEYEKLVTDPEQEINKLANACGLEFEAAMTESHRHSSAMGTASAGQVRQGIYQSANSAWRRFEHHIEPLVQRFNRRDNT